MNGDERNSYEINAGSGAGGLYPKNLKKPAKNLSPTNDFGSEALSSVAKNVLRPFTS